MIVRPMIYCALELIEGSLIALRRSNLARSRVSKGKWQEKASLDR